MTPVLLARPWVVEWYAPFDASDDALDPAAFRRTQSFKTEPQAKQFANRIVHEALGGSVTMYREHDDDA